MSNSDFSTNRRPLQFSLLTLLLALGIVPAVTALLYMWAGEPLYVFFITVVVVIAANVWPRFMSPGEIRLDTGSPTNSLWWMRMGVPFVWLELPSTMRHLMGFSVPEAKPRWIVPIGIVVNILIAAAVAYLAAGIITMACSFRRVRGDPVPHASEPERLNTGEERTNG